jgi:hypothetical protein
MIYDLIIFIHNLKLIGFVNYFCLTDHYSTYNWIDSIITDEKLFNYETVYE